MVDVPEECDMRVGGHDVVISVETRDRIVNYKNVLYEF